MYNTGPLVIKLLQPVKSSQFTCIYILYILNVYNDTYHYMLEEFSHWKFAHFSAATDHSLATGPYQS